MQRVSRAIAFFIHAWRRIRMLILRPAFERHGRNFLFDPDGYYTYQNIQVGDDVSLGRGAVLMAANSQIKIGDKVLFGPNVSVIAGNHNTSVVGKFMYDVTEKRPEDDQDVIIENDVWIGAGAIILKGVRVGRGSVVAAGAVVTRDVAPYSIAAGAPATLKSMRFDPETIQVHERILYPLEKAGQEE